MTDARTLAISAVTAFLLALSTGCGADDSTTSTTPAEAADTAAAGEASSTTVSGDQSSASAPAYPATVESCGTDYRFENSPERVVLGWPTSYDTLDRLGVADRVVGYFSGSFASLPDSAPDIPEISPDFTPSREAMVEAGADLVIVNDLTSLAGDTGGVSLDDLAAAGTNVFVLGDYCGYDTPAPTTVDVVTQDITDLGAIFGVSEEADELVAELEGRLAEAAVGQQQPTAVVQVVDGTLYALNGTNYAALLDAVGLANLFADLEGNWSEISAEVVLTLDPEIIVAVHETSESPEAAADAVRQLLANSAAVTEDRIITVANSDLSAGGVSLVDVIEQVAAAIEE